MGGKNNEAKIKFTAEAEDLNSTIDSAKSKLKVMRAELKENASEAKANGESQDNLKARLNILNQEMDAASQKTEATSQKLEIAQRIFGENSTEVANLKVELSGCRTVENNIQADINKTNKALNEQENAADDAAAGLDGLGNEAKSAEKEVSGLGDIALGNVIADYCTRAIDSLAGLEQETREYRDDMSKLDTAFETNGFSAEQARGSYEGLFAVIGESDRSVETANHLAKLCNTQQELDKWTTICTGVYATFGDSLPIEGLTEAANETAKVGQITGPLADAINWSTTSTEEWNTALSGNKTALAAFNKGISQGMSAEDAFNEALAACGTEQERSALITESLNSLYSESAGAFEEMNGSVMDANSAEAELVDAQARLGEQIAPLQTAVTNLAAGGIGFLADHFGKILPVITGLGAAIGVLTIAIKGQEIVTKAAAVTQGIFNTVMSANPIGIVIALIAGLVAAFVVLWNKSESFRNFFTEMWGGIKSVVTTVVAAVKEKFSSMAKTISTIFNAIKGTASKIWNAVKKVIVTVVSGIVGGVKGKFVSMRTTVTSVFNGIKSIASRIFNGVKSAITRPVETAAGTVKKIVQRIKGFFTSLRLKIPKPELPSLPHFSLKTKSKTILGKTITYPAGFDIQWHAAGAVFSAPTLLKSANGWHGVGEAGPEAIAPISTLQKYIADAVQTATGAIDIDRMAEKIAAAAAKLNIIMKVDRRELGRIIKEA